MDKVARLRQHALSKGGFEIGMDYYPPLSSIIDAVRPVFGLSEAKAFHFKQCGCFGFPGGVLLDMEQLSERAVVAEKHLMQLEEKDGVWRCFDPWSIVWFAVAHEFAHTLQATRHAWPKILANEVAFETGADYLAGFCIGWLQLTHDINFLNASVHAYLIGQPIPVTHPRPHHRRLAFETGVAHGYRAVQVTGGVVSPHLHRIALDMSEIVVPQLEKVTTRRVKRR